MSYHLRIVPSSARLGSGVTTFSTCRYSGVTLTDCSSALTTAASSVRVKSMTQFVSHVSPSSSEKACSQRGVGVVTRDHVNRTRIGLPSNVSAPSKTPVSPVNEPITGGSSSPGRRLSAQ